MFSSTERTLPSDRARLLLTLVVTGFSLTTEAVVFSFDGIGLFVAKTPVSGLEPSLSAVGCTLSITASFLAVGFTEFSTTASFLTVAFGALFSEVSFLLLSESLKLSLLVSLSVFVSFFKLLIALVKLFTLLFISSWVAVSLASNNSASLIAFSKFATDSEVFPPNTWALACCKTLSNWTLFTLAFFTSWFFSEVSVFSETLFLSGTEFFSEATASLGLVVSLETAFPPATTDSFGVETSPVVTVVFDSTALSVAWAGAANAKPVAKNKVQPKAITFPFFTIRQFFCTVLLLLNNI